jgi:hypothetical protein
MASKAKKKAAKKSPPKKHRIPRQEVLAGIGDAKIAAIENAALDYAELRDQRQELTRQEVDLKKKLIDLMHKKELKEYKRNGISVKLVVEEEGVKVRVKESEDDLPADIGPAPEANVSAESVAVDAEA